MARGKVRDKSKEALWRKTMQAYRRSGLQIREFCRREKLRETAFYFWRREIARRTAQGQPAAKAPSRRRKLLFVPVRVTPQTPPPTGSIDIEFARGRRIHLTPPVDRQTLHDLLFVMEARPC